MAVDSCVGVSNTGIDVVLGSAGVSVAVGNADVLVATTGSSVFVSADSAVGESVSGAGFAVAVGSAVAETKGLAVSVAGALLSMRAGACCTAHAVTAVATTTIISVI